MAELRGAPTPSPEALRSLAQNLSGFSEPIIEAACVELENAEIAPFENKMPSQNILIRVCQKHAQEVNTRRERWCGRCDEGVIRVSGEYRRCPCCCPLCNNTGLEVVKRDGSHFNPDVDAKEFREARRCACRTAVREAVSA